jgi:6-phosphogluconate dehydrogenase
MRNKIYFIMGVSGCGKSTIARMLAQHLDIQYFDGDDFHPAANVQKMAKGIPLTDDDRFDWLKSLNHAAQQCVVRHQSAVFACSALKESYRQILMQNIENQSIIIYLQGDFQTILQRMTARKGHFMPLELLKSQFDILEVPQKAITIDIKNQPIIIIQKIMEKIQKAQFGMVGLGVMGKNLARNFGRNGISLALFNRFVAGSEEKVAENAIQNHSELKSALGFEDLQAFVLSLERPRKILLMINAGAQTDSFIQQIAPYLEPDDILIDGGNTHFKDTKRRMLALKAQNIHLIGTGISGGARGALEGASIMPSGDAAIYKQIEPYLNRIAAKDKAGKPCCIYIGVEGAGHFVKMVHNGIEYAEMQLIAEIYAYFRYIKCKTLEDISAIFSDWAKGDLKSYLLEITAKILLKKEGEDYILEQILDKAGNKGTGNWATIASSELGIPATMITASLFARYVSTIKSNYDKFCYQNSDKTNNLASDIDLKNAYTLARMVNHQQGFLLLRTASETFEWNLNLSEIARIWTNGCIIRSVFMEKLASVHDKQHDLFENKDILKQIMLIKGSLKTFCMTSMQYDLPIPCHSEALNYLNALIKNRPTAHIIQAQRDFFGAHRYQKVNDATGKTHHTHWE